MGVTMDYKETKTEYSKKLKKAQRRVKEIKGFYWHLAIYVIVNGFMLINYFISHAFGGDFEIWILFMSVAGWGVGLGIHFWEVFGKDLVFGANWEERKIEKLMQKEAEEMDRYQKKQ
ncbi:2TM domain-containing protein [Robertkochia solimangrovi]|uniref:2TM domain-containing protein n=1 Tax=Robertkochia solimangrovi TaxID=2213046 RepID=UPI00118072E0|nr:2TM domain-containing protein [Robertkochia solimangrovi]TRZ42833.1 hypothetical protein DMZ48_12245 [Robertkochia solimangrovi]